MSLFIVDYTEKAIAVFGETKSYKNKLSEIGGKYNASLTHENEKKAGWIFSKAKRDIVKQTVMDINEGKVPKEESLGSNKKKDSNSDDEKKDNRPYTNNSMSNSQGSLNLQNLKEELLKEFIPKKDFMNLVSKVERLEQEIAILKGGKEGFSSSKDTPSGLNPSKKNTYNGMVKLTSTSSASSSSNIIPSLLSSKCCVNLVLIESVIGLLLKNSMNPSTRLFKSPATIFLLI
jgi:hypothetical protein